MEATRSNDEAEIKTKFQLERSDNLDVNKLNYEKEERILNVGKTNT